MEMRTSNKSIIMMIIINKGFYSFFMTNNLFEVLHFSQVLIMYLPVIIYFFTLINFITLFPLLKLYEICQGNDTISSCSCNLLVH